MRCPPGSGIGLFYLFISGLGVTYLFNFFFSFFSIIFGILKKGEGGSTRR